MVKPNIKKIYTSIAVVLLANTVAYTNISAKTFTIPSNGDDVVGAIQEVSPNELKPNDNFLTLSKRYGVGFHELEEANPNASPWTPNYGDIIIPHKYVLPKIREGIVINLAELRLYYFPKGTNKVMTYPVGIGKKDWATPVVTTTITQKIRNPSWTVPDSIKEEYEARGEEIADVIPSGPDNPLGNYALRLGAPGYLLHGTNANVGVGLRVSHGCIRLFNHDIKQLFNKVPAGTKVSIINEPYKVGSDGGKIFLEAHKPLSEDGDRYDYDESLIKSRLYNVGSGYRIDWNAAEYVAEELRGIPAPIGNM